MFALNRCTQAFTLATNKPSSSYLLDEPHTTLNILFDLTVNLLPLLHCHYWHSLHLPWWYIHAWMLTFTTWPRALSITLGFSQVQGRLMLLLLAMPAASLTLIWLCKATRNLVGHRPWLSFLKQKCRKRVVIDSAPQNTEGLHCRQLSLSQKLSPSFWSAIVRYPLPMLRPTLLPYSVSCLLISLVSSTVSAKGIRSSM